MGRSVGKNLIKNQFADVALHQKLDSAHRHIEELTAEIERLKALGDKQAEELKVVELRSSLEEEGMRIIPLSQIEPNLEQPRQTFSEKNILLLARSLERDGQQQPILVFPKNTEQYLLFDGERRWRAAQKLNWENIEALVIPKCEAAWIENPATLRRKALLANHHRENLNSLDLAEALIAEIAITHRLEKKEIPRWLDAVIARLTRRQSVDLLTSLVSATSEEQEAGLMNLEKDSLIKKEEKLILQFLLSLQLNPASVKANIFPSLKLFDDLKGAVRKKGLGSHQARILQRLSPKNLGQTEAQSQEIRQQLTEVVLGKKLSVTETQKLVREKLAHYNNSEKAILSKEVSQALAQIEKVKPEKLERDELKVLEVSLKQKLKEIRKVLKN